MFAMSIQLRIQDHGQYQISYYMDSYAVRRRGSQMLDAGRAACGVDALEYIGA